MAKQLVNLIVIAHDGKKMRIPDARKVILAVRAPDLRQHQASVNVSIDNIDRLRVVTTAPLEEIERLKKMVRRGPI